MAGRQTDRHQQICAFGSFWYQRAIADRIRREATHLYVTLVFYHHFAVFFDNHPLTIVRIHCVSRHSNPVCHHGLTLAIGLGHHIFAYHPAGFADVKLVRKVAVIPVFIFGIAPLAHLVAEMFRHSRVVSDEIKESFGVGFVVTDDLGPAFGVGVRVVEIGTNHIGGQASAIVDVGFAVGHRHKVHQVPRQYVGDSFTGRKLPKQQFVFGRIISIGAGNGDAVGRVVGQAHPVVEGLHRKVARAIGSEFGIAHAINQAAFGLARNFVGVNAIRKLVFIEQLNPVPGLAILRVGFAANGKFCSSLRH